MTFIALGLLAFHITALCFSYKKKKKRGGAGGGGGGINNNNNKIKF